MSAYDDIADGKRWREDRSSKRIGFILLFYFAFHVLDFCELVLVGFDFIITQNRRAGDSIWLILLRWLEGDVVAQSRCLDHHEICAGARLFDEGYAIGGLRVAMVLYSH